MSIDDLAAALQEAIDTHSTDSPEMDLLYATLHDRGQLKSHRVLTYRCPHRCLLVDVLNTPSGTLVHLPQYKVSADLNAERSTAWGREHHTVDGDRRWRGRTFFIGTALSVEANCDHVTRYLISNKRIVADLAARCHEVMVSGDDML